MRKINGKTFSDVWELRVDLPGAEEGFDEAEFDVDPRFARLGPFRQCFYCGRIGRTRECAGSCRDTERSAAFCDAKCQQMGWPQHKKEQGCSAER